MKTLFLMMFVLLLAGCAAYPEAAEKKMKTPSDRKLGGEVLLALQKHSFRSFSKALSGRTTLRLTENVFDGSLKDMEARLGRISSWQYLADLEDPLIHTQVWFVRFEQKGKTGKIHRRDSLFRILSGRLETEKEYRVIGLGFY